MNSWKLQSSKEITVKPITGKIASTTMLSRISMSVRVLFGRPSVHSDISPWTNTPSKLLNLLPNRWVSSIRNTPLEDMMSQVLIKINQLPDESIIAIAHRIYTQFWDWTKQNRVIEIEFINSDIMPLIWKDETLPTMFFWNCSTIIEKFWIIIKERLNKIRQQKLAEIVESTSRRIDQLPDNDSVVRLASTINTVLWKRVEWDNQLKIEYINQILIPFIGIKGHLQKILEKDIDTILEGFHNTVQQKAISILQKKRDKLVPRIVQSK